MVAHLDPRISVAALAAAAEYIDCRLKALPDGSIALVLDERRQALNHYQGVLKDAQRNHA